MSVTKKINNYEYAPGIGTYGINGKDGKTGESGTTVFISVYDVNEKSGAESFATAVRYSYDMSSNEHRNINRAYKNGDCFVMQSTADIYKITDVDQIIRLYVYSQTTVESLSKCIEHVGSIKATNDNSGFNESDGKLVLDTNRFNGFVINTSDTEITNINAPFTIASTTSDNNNNIYFVSLNGINQQTNTFLNIYYDTDNNCYYLESDTPVLIDADLKVKYNESVDFDGYSRVMTSTDTNNVSLSTFYSFCKNMKCTLHRNYDNVYKFQNKLILKFETTSDYDNTASLDNQSVRIFIMKNNGTDTYETIKDFYRYPVNINNGSIIEILLSEETEKELIDDVKSDDIWKKYSAKIVVENAVSGLITAQSSPEAIIK